MPMYLCRWPNGDCSVVQASNEQDAIITLNEIADAEGCPIIPLQECQVHFHLTDEGQRELETFGEETESELWDFCYPVLDEVVPDKSPEQWSTHEREAVRQGVLQEWQRVRSADSPRGPDGASRRGGDAQEAEASSDASLKAT